MSTSHVDLLVVGAGIVGLAHAARARDAGLSVLVIDRDHAQNGASVRNFGHVGSTLQTGEVGALAREAREAWLRLGSQGAVEIARTGTVVLAENDLELAVLEDLAASTPDDVRVLTAAQVEAMTGIEGHRGAHFPHDLRVNPREAAPRLGEWLQEQRDVEIRWATSYLGRNDDGSHRTSRGDVHAERTVVAVGHDLDQLAPDAAHEHGIERCRLQMTRVDAGLPTIRPALLTATSMLRYGAFGVAPGFDAFATDARARLTELVGIDANLMMTQLPDGTLIVGDSHASAVDAPPFLDERVTTVLLDAARTLLGRDLRVVERWQGVYATSPVAPYLVREIAPGTTAVAVTTGLGMTISHALAAKTL